MTDKTKTFEIFETPRGKACRGPGYNYVFSKEDGSFARWGDTKEEDPQWAPPGPEILDLEISVDGCPNACTFCYKENKATPATNMTLATFKAIMDRMPKTLTQIAFGITGIQTNPDFIPMLAEARKRGVVPNFTLSGIDLTPEIAAECANYIGAVAVSLYEKDLAPGLEAIRLFTELGINQTNVHLMVSEETLPFVRRILEERRSDPKGILGAVNCFVLLGVKPKGRAKVGEGFHSLPVEKFTDLVKYALGNDVPIGFDSCSAPKFEAAVRSMDLPQAQLDALIQVAESCESGLFSSYIDVSGIYWPCSFTEGFEGIQGMNVLEHDSFLEIWHGPEVSKWRKGLLATAVNGCRFCPAYPEINP